MMTHHALRKTGFLPFAAIAGFCIFGVFLAGCAGWHGTRQTAPDSLKTSSYAAADMLIQQSRGSLRADSPLEIGPLDDIDHPGTITGFGQIVTAQIASRFVQLGYNVQSNPFESAHIPAREPDPAGLRSPAYTYNSGAMPDIITPDTLITGRYARGRHKILVHLRLVEKSSGKVLAAYDYHVPVTADTRHLSKTGNEGFSLFGI